MSVLLPGAHDLDRYWSNLLQKVNTLREIPAQRWDWRLYFDEEKTSADKICSKWGGFLDELPFDPTEFGIPPSAAKFIEPMQFLALEAVRRALIDAGCEDGSFDRENTSVIFGASGGLGDLGQLYATRSELPRVVGPMDDQVRNRLPEWSGDSFPGILLNAIAGRIANRFDLGGANYVIDAACASSLASLESAVVRELESGQCNVAIAGGVDTMQSPFGYFCFSKTQALSARGEARVFDKAANGIVISEGIGVMVLKRLVDAERDGDRIYAVIKDFGSSSDGRGASMTVPTNIGQLRALRRAYAKAGFSPATVSLYEAHGYRNGLGRSRRIGIPGFSSPRERRQAGIVRRGIGQEPDRPYQGCSGSRWHDQGRAGPSLQSAAPSCRCGGSSARAARGFKPGLHAQGARALGRKSLASAKGGRKRLWIRRHQFSCGDRGIFRRGGPRCRRRRGLAV